MNHIVFKRPIIIFNLFFVYCRFPVTCIVPLTCYTLVTIDTSCLGIRIKYLVSYIEYFCYILMAIYLNIGHIDFLANVRMLKFGSELRYGIRSPNVRTPVDIPIEYHCNKHVYCSEVGADQPLSSKYF